MLVVPSVYDLAVELRQMPLCMEIMREGSAEEAGMSLGGWAECGGQRRGVSQVRIRMCTDLKMLRWLTCCQSLFFSLCLAPDLELQGACAGGAGSPPPCPTPLPCGTHCLSCAFQL